MSENINELHLLLQDFNNLEIKKSTGPTFLEIVDLKNTEHAWNKLLGFFFDPNKEHRLYDLFISSLFQVVPDINVNINNIKNMVVLNEYQTYKGNRIDLVINWRKPSHRY